MLLQKGPFLPFCRPTDLGHIDDEKKKLRRKDRKKIVKLLDLDTGTEKKTRTEVVREMIIITFLMSLKHFGTNFDDRVF